MRDAASTPASSKIDRDAIERHIDLLFGYLDGIVPVRAIAEKGTGSKPLQSRFCSVAQVCKILQDMAPDAAHSARGLYVVPGTVAQAGSACAEDIRETGVLVVDLDAGDIKAARAHASQYLGPPSFVIASGGLTSDEQEKLHLYWRLTEAASGGDLERVRTLREQLALRLGGDTAFRSLHQPIRVAGTIHGKNGIQRGVRFVEDHGHEHELGDLERAMAAMPAVTGITHRLMIDGGKTPRGTARDLAARTIRAEGLDGITRFEAMSRVIGHWIRNTRTGVCSEAEAREAVADHNQAMIVPPWETQRLNREFDALMRRDCSTKGPMAKPGDSDEAGEDIALTPLSEDALAACLVSDHGAGWRHVPAWGRWQGWSGTRWRRDETGEIKDLARHLCRAAARDAGSPKEARRIASDRTITAVLRLAASDPCVTTGTADWDRHPMLLNTPAGIIDLESGEVAPHDPTRLITQITAASPGDGCPRWDTFIKEITGDDPDLQSYLARLAGYCLTGKTTEQVFAFCYGSGANGKSVFLQTLGAVMGDYAATATLDTFMATRTDRHLTELAGLRAARLVLVPETEAGRAWAEARIKTVTGGETIRANFMHRDHFEYAPQFKLLVAGNHRPALASSGEAMRRRLHLVPFEVTIPPESRDLELAEKLRAERDGILGWMLAGCRDWQRMGLAPPARVQAAADAYFDSEDLIGQWIEDCCTTGPARQATARALYASWSAWAEAAGQRPGSQKALGEALRERAFKPCKIAGGRGWVGISPGLGCDGSVKGRDG